MRRAAVVLVLILTGAALVCRSQSQTTSPASPQQDTLMTVELCESLADELSRLPAWTETSPKTVEDWSALAVFARTLQQLPPSDVRAVLFAYMVKYKANDYAKAVDVATRPMLVLRLMFDIPQDAPMALAFAEGEPLADLMRAAGRIPNEDGTDDTISAPLTWRDGRPRVMGVPRASIPPQTINARPVEYQPQKEYEFFRAKYAKRTNLENLIAR